MSSAVVFAYHNVGVRCLRVLLAGGVDVRLVVTHEDSAKEHIWFGSVQQLCIENNIPFITPTDPNTPEIEARIAALRAEFISSLTTGPLWTSLPCRSCPTTMRRKSLTKWSLQLNSVSIAHCPS